MPNKVGMVVGYYPAQIDWVQLCALHANGLIILDEYDLPGDWLPGHIVVYRGGSDKKHVVLNWNPAGYAQYLYAWHRQKGNRFCNDLLWLNEPNVPLESGYNDPSEAIAHTVNWGLAGVEELRRLYPGKRLHSPPLSPSPEYGDWRALYTQMRPLVEACDVLDVHDYLDCGVDLEYLHSLYPDKPVIVSECGRPGQGMAEYGRQLVDYWRHLPGFVEFAAPFIWCAPGDDWRDWRLQGTAAARVILEAGL
jgi:hypothetical protein